MSVLSNVSIIGQVEKHVIGITPFVREQVQPASYDLYLAESVILQPGKFKLASTREHISLPPHIQGQVHGRSSIGRLGILVHFTAGFIDPGFAGTITLECISLYKTVTLDTDRPVAQIAFTWLDTPANPPYQGRYQNQYGVTPSKFYEADPTPSTTTVGYTIYNSWSG